MKKSNSHALFCSGKLCKSLVFIFLLVIFISDANARSNRKQENLKKTIYLHPMSLSGSLFYSYAHADTTDEFLYIIYSTVKIPFDLSNSLIIQPSLWYAGNSDHDAFRLGSGVGLRHFANGKGDGFYLQAMSSILYFYEYKVYTEAFYADLLGYLGYSWKIFGISTFLDIGIGFAIISNGSMREFAVGTLGYNRPLVFDMNFGMGFSL